MAATRRYFCTEHGFVHPVDDVERTCPDCGSPVTEVGGSG
jgi:hypothetical protein